MKKIIAVGFNYEYYRNDSEVNIKTVKDFNCLLLPDATLAEKYFLLRRLRDDTDGIVVNLSMKKEDLTIDEALFMQIAYTINTPICGVGKREENPFLDSVVLKRFPYIDDAVDYINCLDGGN